MKSPKRAMSYATGPSQPRICLVCIADPLIALDVATILGEVYPSANLISEPDHAAALSAIEGVDSPPVAVLFLNPDLLDQSPLGKRLTELGAAIILMGTAAEESRAPHGHAVLQRPFRTADLVALLPRDTLAG